MQISISNAIGGGGGAQGGGTPTPPPFSNVNSFSFDGVDEIFQGSSIYSELNGGTKLTVSVWVKPISGAPILEYLISNPRNSTSNQHQFALTLYENFNVQLDVQGYNSQYVLGDINAITYGAWNHILVCVDLDRTIGTEGIMFINGVDETTTSAMGTLSSFYTATDALHIGVDANGGYNRYNGNMDELAIWSGQDYRSASEVSAIYNGGVPSDLNNTSGIAQPSLWFRMGEQATFGTQWTMTDVNASYSVTSANMLEANRTTDVPPNPFVNLQSILLDGVDDYVDLGSGSTVADGGQFTLSFWIKGGAAASGGSTYLFSADYYKLHTFWVLQSSNIQWMNINGTRKNLSMGVLDSNWHHILIVFNPTGADQTIRCFTDGANEVNVSTDYRYAASSTTYIGGLRYIGNRGGGSYNGLNGAIDEFAVWDSDESSNLSNIYNGGVPNNLNALSSPPVNWYRMGDGNGGTGSTVTDQGTGGVNGTLTNDAAFEEDVPS